MRSAASASQGQGSPRGRTQGAGRPRIPPPSSTSTAPSADGSATARGGPATEQHSRLRKAQSYLGDAGSSSLVKPESGEDSSILADVGSGRSQSGAGSSGEQRGVKGYMMTVAQRRAFDDPYNQLLARKSSNMWLNSEFGADSTSGVSSSSSSSSSGTGAAFSSLQQQQMQLQQHIEGGGINIVDVDLNTATIAQLRPREAERYAEIIADRKARAKASGLHQAEPAANLIPRVARIAAQIAEARKVPIDFDPIEALQHHRVRKMKTAHSNNNNNNNNTAGAPPHSASASSSSSVLSSSPGLSSIPTAVGGGPLTDRSFTSTSRNLVTSSSMSSSSSTIPSASDAHFELVKERLMTARLVATARAREYEVSGNNSNPAAVAAAAAVVKAAAPKGIDISHALAAAQQANAIPAHTLPTRVAKYIRMIEKEGSGTGTGAAGMPHPLLPEGIRTKRSLTSSLGHEKATTNSSSSSSSSSSLSSSSSSSSSSSTSSSSSATGPGLSLADLDGTNSPIKSSRKPHTHSKQQQQQQQPQQQQRQQQQQQQQTQPMKRQTSQSSATSVPALDFVEIGRPSWRSMRGARQLPTKASGGAGASSSSSSSNSSSAGAGDRSVDPDGAEDEEDDMYTDGGDDYYYSYDGSGGGASGLSLGRPRNLDSGGGGGGAGGDADDDDFGDNVFITALRDVVDRIGSARGSGGNSSSRAAAAAAGGGASSATDAANSSPRQQRQASSYTSAAASSLSRSWGPSTLPKVSIPRLALQSTSSVSGGPSSSSSNNNSNNNGSLSARGTEGGAPSTLSASGSNVLRGDTALIISNNSSSLSQRALSMSTSAASASAAGIGGAAAGDLNVGALANLYGRALGAGLARQESQYDTWYTAVADFARRLFAARCADLRLQAIGSQENRFILSVVKGCLDRELVLREQGFGPLAAEELASLLKFQMDTIAVCVSHTMERGELSRRKSVPIIFSPSSSTSATTASSTASGGNEDVFAASTRLGISSHRRDSQDQQHLTSTSSSSSPSSTSHPSLPLPLPPPNPTHLPSFIAPIVSLNLARNNLGDAGLVVLASVLPSLPFLQHLDVSGNNATSPGISSLVAALTVRPTLRSLDISSDSAAGSMLIGPGIRAAFAIGKLLKLSSQLESLNISNVGLGLVEGAISLVCEGLSHAFALRELDLSSNYLTMSHLKCLAGALLTQKSYVDERRRKVREALHMEADRLRRSLPLSLDDLSAVAALPLDVYDSGSRTRSQSQDSYSRNSLGSTQSFSDTSSSSPSLAAQFHCLEQLYLSRNAFGSPGALPLAELLAMQFPLHTLRVEHCSIGTAGFNLLIDGASKNPFIKQLILNGNLLAHRPYISYQTEDKLEGMREVMKALDVAHSKGQYVTNALANSLSLQRLELNCCGITDAFAKDMGQVLVDEIQRASQVDSIQQDSRSISSSTSLSSSSSSSSSSLQVASHSSSSSSSTSDAVTGSTASDGRTGTLRRGNQGPQQHQHQHQQQQHEGSVSRLPSTTTMLLPTSSSGSGSAVATSLSSSTVLPSSSSSLPSSSSSSSSSSYSAVFLRPAPTSSARFVLTHLSLCHNNIRSEGALAFAPVIASAPTLEHFALSHNDIGDVAGAQIAQALAQSPSMRELLIDNAGVGHETALMLVVSAEQNPNITRIDCRSNKMPYERHLSVLSRTRANYRRFQTGILERQKELLRELSQTDQLQVAMAASLKAAMAQLIKVRERLTQVQEAAVKERESERTRELQLIEARRIETARREAAERDLNAYEQHYARRRAEMDAEAKALIAAREVVTSECIRMDKETTRTRNDLIRYDRERPMRDMEEEKQQGVLGMYTLQAKEAARNVAKAKRAVQKLMKQMEDTWKKTAKSGGNNAATTSSSSSSSSSSSGAAASASSSASASASSSSSSSSPAAGHALASTPASALFTTSLSSSALHSPSPLGSGDVVDDLLDGHDGHVDGHEGGNGGESVVLDASALDGGDMLGSLSYASDIGHDARADTLFSSTPASSSASSSSSSSSPKPSPRIQLRGLTQVGLDPVTGLTATISSSSSSSSSSDEGGSAMPFRGGTLSMWTGPLSQRGPGASGTKVDFVSPFQRFD